MKKIKNLKTKGFTLIELLVVISIIGVLATLIIANLNETRGRARDVRLKQNTAQLKTALQFYYNDFKGFPASASNNGSAFYACGIDGKQTCTPGGAFSAGPVASPTVYMSYLTPLGSFYEFNYYPCNLGDSYRLKVALENGSDPDITPSQNRCPNSSCTLPGGSTLDAYGVNEYIVCP